MINANANATAKHYN